MELIAICRYQSQKNKDPAAEQTQAIGNRRSVKAVSSSGVYTESD